MTLLNLTSPSGRASLTVDCAHGGRLSSLRFNDRQLLISEAASPLNWGSYPLVPFAGRIAEGSFTFEGQTIELPTNLGPHAIHGYGFISEWTIVDDRSIAFDFAEPWPWKGRAVQRFDLSDDQLVCTLGVEATDRQPMQIGWHPWFRRDIGNGHELALNFEAQRMWVRDDEGIPTGETITPPAGPWDDFFDGVNHDPQVSWGDLTVTLSSTLNEWTVFTEHPDGVCVEPQLGPPNRVHATPYVMDAGDVLEEQFTISWTS